METEEHRFGSARDKRVISEASSSSGRRTENSNSCASNLRMTEGVGGVIGKHWGTRGSGEPGFSCTKEKRVMDGKKMINLLNTIFREQRMYIEADY